MTTPRTITDNVSRGTITNTSQRQNKNKTKTHANTPPAQGRPPRPRLRITVIPDHREPPAAPQAPRPDPPSTAFPFPLATLFLSLVTLPRRPGGAAGTARQRQQPSARPRTIAVIADHRWSAHTVHAGWPLTARTRADVSTRTLTSAREADATRRRDRQHVAGHADDASAIADRPHAARGHRSRQRYRWRSVAGRSRPSAHRARTPAMTRSHG